MSDTQTAITLPPDSEPEASEPLEHFKLYFFAAATRVLAHGARTCGGEAALLARFPFLESYREELSELGVAPVEADDGPGPWPEAIAAWEADVSGHLPLRALRRAAGLDHEALTLLLAVGMVEEDARFGALFSSMQGTPTLHRPTLGLLNASWRGEEDRGEVRSRLRRLMDLGLVEVSDREAPRSEWALHVPGPVWDALRGEAPERPAPWLKHHARETLSRDEPLIVPDALREALGRLPALLASGEARALVVRGPHHNGRRTLLRSVARALGRGVLEVEGPQKADDARWRMVGPLATLLHALPVVVLEPAPGEAAEVPELNGLDGPLGVVLGRLGGVSGDGVDRALTLNVDMPGPEERALHWTRALAGRPCSSVTEISESFRLTRGHVRRAARLAQAHAALAGRSEVEPADVREAARALNRQALDTLAVRLTASGDWSQLSVAGETLRELRLLEARCRHRERMGVAVGGPLAGQLTPGVRALFQGPSGTGKTLAARLVAAALGLDVYRVELSSVVNKYIGETEKNLSRIFALAEELDVVLLFDEGDSLFARRTGVGSSTDRYANLETNYLLQRIESYEGILVVTTNAADAIDSAFQRRMDVVVDFRAPDPSERWMLWQLHLPTAHAVDTGLLREVAVRCQLSGGQIRNAVLHASLLALEEGTPMGSAHLEASVVREYRKAGDVCPLRRAGATSLRG
ncbi:ATP-binding protein [Myxococcus sp. RHSTA-1-4]|uniref:ATP-binding protein n=1 Tax=Myxococcus sp. RHSTA-1-4 TaxID=2874601 RepID=UPI001CC0BA66|nr:ATP-binding protein [Myxococcus sp. RHSTA-1-4]MBZ4417834.1 AAA family ATPase [Myxococcus sp. RHSTA-1-4]